jgi:hypothetical protein
MFWEEKEPGGSEEEKEGRKKNKAKKEQKGLKRGEDREK